jgi:hypothetical protein
VRSWNGGRRLGVGAGEGDGLEGGGAIVGRRFQQYMLWSSGHHAGIDSERMRSSVLTK